MHGTRCARGTIDECLALSCEPRVFRRVESVGATASNEKTLGALSPLLRQNLFCQLRARSPQKNFGSHIDAFLSRQPIVKGERMVRSETSAATSLLKVSIKQPTNICKKLGFCFSFGVLAAPSADQTPSAFCNG